MASLARFSRAAVAMAAHRRACTRGIFVTALDGPVDTSKEEFKSFVPDDPKSFLYITTLNTKAFYNNPESVIRLSQEEKDEAVENMVRVMTKDRHSLFTEDQIRNLVKFKDEYKVKEIPNACADEPIFDQDPIPGFLKDTDKPKTEAPKV
ncbi:hypothetical protein FVE85_5560 [Porphyridium purpureum]|uniref:Uncharacterized protein n=1 Tax=Porphyridium purpureum TaxID=35688 RepID=A0A5J4Z3S6_PORPP|nr:hypothetical protein FVE85_5560 [Porphyridium purpureum]|eukprot:POR0751..scf295_1